jgi:hypothetical protein
LLAGWWVDMFVRMIVSTAIFSHVLISLDSWCVAQNASMCYAGDRQGYS